MRFLIDTDICSAHLKHKRSVSNRFLQYTGDYAFRRLHSANCTHGYFARAPRQNVCKV